MKEHVHPSNELQLIYEEHSDYIHQLGTMRLTDLMQELSILKWDLKLFENEITFNGNTSLNAVRRKERTSEKLVAVEKEIRIRTGLDHQ